MPVKKVYANTSASGFALDFFENASPKPRNALLVAPFFTSVTPIEQLTKRGCEVQLIIRLCNVTTPSAIKSALNNRRVSIRFYTSRLFHSKFYIIDDVALVGSSNLTENGLMTNRELNISLQRNEDEAFSELPTLFDDLWNYADVLTEGIADQFEKAFKALGRPSGEDDFDRFLLNYIDKVEPKSVRVGSHVVSKKRAFLQAFRRKYDEVLNPAHDEIMRVFHSGQFGRSEFSGEDPRIEIGRFLGWIRLVHGSGTGWRETRILTDEIDRAARISDYLKLWQTTEDLIAGDIYNVDREIANIRNIQEQLRNPIKISELNYEQMFNLLCGCHAFIEQLRFTKGGLDGLCADFSKRNDLDQVKQTVSYLINGSGDPLERAYDCIYDQYYRLERFAEACVMELLGWGSVDRPPFNNRSIRGMRLLGFDVEHLVANE